MAFEPQGLRDWLLYQTPEIIEQKYNLRIDAINDNYERVRKFANFEKWFVDEYKEILDDLYSQAQKIR